MKNGEKPIANPFVILREEFDDWAVLFDPDTGRGFGLNPTGVYLWKLLGKEYTIDTLLEAIREHVVEVPEDVRDHTLAFVDELVREGLAGSDVTALSLLNEADTATLHPEKCSSSFELLSDVKPFMYEPPRLVNLNSVGRATAAGMCGTGYSNSALYCQGGGTDFSCAPGSSAAPCAAQGDYCNDGSNGNFASCAPGGCAGRHCQNFGVSASSHCMCGTSPFVTDC